MHTNVCFFSLIIINCAYFNLQINRESLEEWKIINEANLLRNAHSLNLGFIVILIVLSHCYLIPLIYNDRNFGR